MRTLGPWIASFVVVVASCQSAVLLPLPWGESADTWGIVVAPGAAVLAHFAVRYLLRRTGRHGS